ncbi:hypothetical protein [Pseudohalioglobus lutimaris]|nr:hypothetical protein [Pseudohalioglobus lutimaris]
MRMYTVIVSLASLILLASPTRADFWKDLRDAVEESVTDTAEDIAIGTAEQLIQNMIIKYSTRRTRSEKEVREEYEEEQGELPRFATATEYRTEILPGSLVAPGDDVRIRSYIEIIPGNTGEEARIEERLTIWDNENNSVALKDMTKEAGKESGGVFRGEFSFTLPEGLPQGLYPITTELLLNGEMSGDRKLQLQLVLQKRNSGAVVLLASNQDQ